MKTNTALNRIRDLTPVDDDGDEWATRDRALRIMALVCTCQNEVVAGSAARTEFWKYLTPKERALFQVMNPYLAMPMGVYMDSVSETVGRKVDNQAFTLGSKHQIMRELFDVL